jgi:tRNA pseudouridine38-40 synthase
VKLVLHYEGRDFYGWQIQPDRRTVQGELSALLGQLFGGEVPMLTGAGRTDQGVHATGQVASAMVPDRFDEEELLRALNALAPTDLWIASAERVDDSFHARYDATSRTYVYRLGVTPETLSPFSAPWCWPLGRELDWDLTDSATAVLVGRHDFSAFAKSGQPERGVHCEVHRALWRDSPETNGVREFEIEADRYLHRMVRYLVGTLVDIGLTTRPLGDMEGLLSGQQGLVASPPAPAKGLFLTRVEYSREHTDNSRQRSSGEANEDLH